MNELWEAVSSPDNWAYTGVDLVGCSGLNGILFIKSSAQCLAQCLLSINGSYYVISKKKGLLKCWQHLSPVGGIMVTMNIYYFCNQRKRTINVIMNSEVWLWLCRNEPAVNATVLASEEDKASSSLPGLYGQTTCLTRIIGRYLVRILEILCPHPAL